MIFVLSNLIVRKPFVVHGTNVNANFRYILSNSPQNFVVMFNLRAGRIIIPAVEQYDKVYEHIDKPA